MKVKLKFTEEVLGTATPDPEVYAKYIASLSPNLDQEIKSLPDKELMTKADMAGFLDAPWKEAEAEKAPALTVFHRGVDGNPILYDYQIRGFIKEALGAKVEFRGMTIGKSKAKLSKWTYRRMVDNYIFVSPRVIALDMQGANMGICTRPLRAETMQGPRVALAASETVPVGTTCEIEITVLEDDLMPLVIECLDYGKHKGIGQWRNSGKGRFEWLKV